MVKKGGVWSCAPNDLLLLATPLHFILFLYIALVDKDLHADFYTE